MNITRDVIVDLLPVYESGEASADTRALVDEFLQSDAELARLVEAVRRVPAVAAAPPVSAPTALELEAVRRTKRALRMRGWIMGFAIFFTLLPFSFSVGDVSGYGTFFMLRDVPESRFSFVVALVLWFVYARQSWKLRPSGW